MERFSNSKEIWKIQSEESGFTESSKQQVIFNTHNYILRDYKMWPASLSYGVRTQCFCYLGVLPQIWQSDAAIFSSGNGNKIVINILMGCQCILLSDSLLRYSLQTVEITTCRHWSYLTHSSSLPHDAEPSQIACYRNKVHRLEDCRYSHQR